MDQTSGKVSVNFLGDINMQGNTILDVGKITGYLGKWSMDENGKLIVEEIETKKLKVENGVTTRDRTTGEYYCIFVDGGAVKTEKGECGARAASSSQLPASSAEISTTATSTPTTDELTATTIEISTSTTTIPGITATSTVDSETATTTTTVTETISTATSTVGSETATTTATSIIP